MSNEKEGNRGKSSKTGSNPQKLPNNSASKSSGQELNASREPRSLQQALINMFPRDFYSFLFGIMAVTVAVYALATNDLTLLWSVWASVGVLVGIVPRAKQGLQWAKDNVQLKNPSDTSLIE